MASVIKISIYSNNLLARKMTNIKYSIKNDTSFIEWMIIRARCVQFRKKKTATLKKVFENCIGAVCTAKQSFTQIHVIWREIENLYLYSQFHSNEVGMKSEKRRYFFFFFRCAYSNRDRVIAVDRRQ